MSGYIIHFDTEEELKHYGIKGMKWKHKKGKTEVQETTQSIKGMKWDPNKRMYKDPNGVYVPEEYYEELKSNSYKFNDPKYNRQIDKWDAQNHARKSAKLPLQTTAYKRKQNKVLNARAKKVENQLYKDLQSGKNMKKTYKMGKAGINFKQDSSGTSAYTYGNYGGRYRKKADKVLSKAYSRHINSQKQKDSGIINKGKKMISNWLKKIF